MQTSEISPYILLPRNKWATLRDSEPLTLSESEIAALKGIDDELSIDEVRDIYLPLSRLLNYYVNAQANRRLTLMNFLREEVQYTPFIIGIAGSVSVGKSTTARVLQALLSRWKEHRKVSLIATDGFLYPNAILQEKGLMQKKGFPESYNIKQLIDFVKEIKSGKPKVQVPVYSHLIYDIVADRHEVVEQPDILILEGLNVLQSGVDYPQYKDRVFVSDFLDFSIYVDAEKDLLEHWYISRFLKLRRSAFANPESYFHNYSHLSDDEAVKTARKIWDDINLKNLYQNILPTRERADLILHKSDSHAADYVKLRK